jgi:Tol biopolymer transport system component
MITLSAKPLKRSLIWALALSLLLTYSLAHAVPEPLPGTLVELPSGIDGSGADYSTRRPSLSADGRYVAFESWATNLVPGDTNGVYDIFVYDRATARTERVSVSSTGVQGDSFSDNASISADGRYGAFFSSAQNLVPGERPIYGNNIGFDIYVHDRQTRQTTRVSVASDGTPANVDSFTGQASISADGRYVVFYTAASNLAPQDTNDVYDVFLHDRQTGETSLISGAPDGSPGNGGSTQPTISPDGRYIAFLSEASNLAGGGRARKIVLYDRQLKSFERVSVALDGGDGRFGVGEVTPSISADGRYVAFSSYSANFVPNDTNGHDVFIYDRQLDRMISPSLAAFSNLEGSLFIDVALSPDGRYLAYVSSTVFIYDQLTGQSFQPPVSRSSFAPSFSGDGQTLALTSDGSWGNTTYDKIYLFSFDPIQLPERDIVCFAETQQCTRDRFTRFWNAQGQLPVFGYPTTTAASELNRDLNTPYLTQWFERNRFELHPENQAPYDILLGRLGDERLRQLGIAWETLPKGAGPQPGCRWFETTGHTLCDQAAGRGFKRYWESHGLEFDGQPGASEAESLALFGLPLSEPRMETNSSGDYVLTQWFERARFEWHPQNPDEYKVLLGLLGNEVRASR